MGIDNDRSPEGQKYQEDYVKCMIPKKIESNRNAVIVDYIKTGDKIVKIISIECKDESLREHLQGEAHRVHYAVTEYNG